MLAGDVVLLSARVLWMLDQVQYNGQWCGFVVFHPLIPCQALGHALVSSPIKETFAKLSGTAIIC